MSIYSKILKLDRRILFIIMLIIGFYITYAPIGLPVVKAQWVDDFYNTIDALEPGDYVFISWSCDPAIVDALTGSSTAMKQLTRKPGIKMIHWITRPEGIILAQERIDDADPEQYGKTYGEDWVNLGYIAGGETALAAFGSDFKGAVKVDVDGTDLDSLDIWNDFDGDWSKVKVIISFGYKEATDDLRRQIQTNYGIPIMHIGSGLHFHGQFHFYTTGSIVGMLFGQTDNAAYDILVGTVTRAIIATDALSATHVMLMAYIVIGNIAFFLDKYTTNGGSTS